MSKHAKPETPLERADRLIWELTIPAWFSEPPRHHATDRRWDVRKELIDEFHAFPQRILCGVITDRKDLWERNLAAIRWQIENRLFGKALQ
ncbi:hypothetical protein D3C74_296690 [compost metagenome]